MFFSLEQYQPGVVLFKTSDFGSSSFPEHSHQETPDVILKQEL